MEENIGLWDDDEDGVVAEEERACGDEEVGILVEDVEDGLN